MYETLLPIGVRAWVPPRRKRKGRRPKPKGGRFTFIFDTETTTDAAQLLRVGCFRILDEGRLIQEGLFFKHVTQTERDLLDDVADEEEGLAVLSMEQFREFFYHYAYELKATVVG